MPLPPVWVPPHQTSPPAHGLLSVADVLPESGSHWQIAGVEYDCPARVGEVVVGSVACPDDPDFGDGDEGFDPRTDVPVRLSTVLAAKPVGRTLDDFRVLAREQLRAGEGPALEQVLWSTHATDPRFMHEDMPTPTGLAAVGVLDAVGALDAWLYSHYAGTGMIHVSRKIVGHLVKAKAVRHDGGRLCTQLGTPVVAGAYPGTGPEDQTPDAGQVWIAATGDVRVRRTEVLQATDGDFDPATNTVTTIAQRIYVASWDGLSAAALVDVKEL